MWKVQTYGHDLGGMFPQEKCEILAFFSFYTLTTVKNIFGIATWWNKGLEPPIDFLTLIYK